MPNQLVPNPLIFQAVLSIGYRRDPPKIDGSLDDWPDDYRLPCLAEMDGMKPFADVSMAWNETGLFLAVRVTGRTQPPRGDRERFWEPDSLRLFTDMRDTKNVHRAGRFCQQWYFLPDAGKGKGEPLAASAPVHRARENAETYPPGRVAVASKITDGGYSLEAAIPAALLAGFEPESHNRIGFCYYLADRELGSQYLTVGGQLPYHTDPSLWASAVLRSE